MHKISATFLAAVVAASVFASTAQARMGGGGHFAMFILRAGAHAAEQNAWEQQRRRRYEAEARQRRIAEARQAAAAKRARLIALEKREAQKLAAAEAAKQTAAAETTPELKPVLKKSDRLPETAAVTSQDDASKPATKTATVATTEEATPVAANTCRRYSAAADGLVDTPCE